jgi:hypothetical protein
MKKTVKQQINEIEKEISLLLKKIQLLNKQL